MEKLGCIGLSPGQAVRVALVNLALWPAFDQHHQQQSQDVLQGESCMASLHDDISDTIWYTLHLNGGTFSPQNRRALSPAQFSHIHWHNQSKAQLVTCMSLVCRGSGQNAVLAACNLFIYTMACF